jgi:glutathione S-transferase
MIKLYWSPRSRSFTTLWLMEESGLPYERVLTDITTGAQKAPDYLKVNPMGKVPALSDGDAALGEAAAICAYIADRYPETKLAPAATDPRRALSAMAVLLAGLHRARHHPDLHQDRDSDLDRSLGQRDAGVRRAGSCARKGAVDSR